MVNIFNVKTVQRLANWLVGHWFWAVFVNWDVFFLNFFWLYLFFLKITYKVIDVRLFTKNIFRLFQLIDRKLKQIELSLYLTFMRIYFMNFRIKAYLIVSIFLLVVEIWNVTQIFKEILCFEWITVKRRFLLGLVRGALPCCNFF